MKIIIPILRAHRLGGSERGKEKTGTQRAEVLLTAGMFALKGPFKSTCCQGRSFSPHLLLPPHK